MRTRRGLLRPWGLRQQWRTREWVKTMVVKRRARMKRAWRRGETVGEVVARAMSGGGWVSCCLGLEGRGESVPYMLPAGRRKRKQPRRRRGICRCGICACVWGVWTASRLVVVGVWSVFVRGRRIELGLLGLGGCWSRRLLLRMWWMRRHDLVGAMVERALRGRCRTKRLVMFPMGLIDYLIQSEYVLLFVQRD